jgi:GT2 family glycosyltransferase
MMSDTPLVSVIVLSLNSAGVIRPCLDSLRQSDYPNLEILVVDNGSADGTPEIVAREYPGVRLVRLPRNRGYAGGMNVGLKAARGEIFIPLNDDTIIPPAMVREQIQPLLRDPKVAIVGCKILFPDRKTIQHAGGAILPNGLTRHFGYKEEDLGQWDEPREVDYVTGCSVAIPRRIFEQFGLLDDHYFPAYYEEVDFSAKVVKAGYKIVYQPGAFLYHLESRVEGRYSPRFLYYYNKSRWRFVLKNFSARQILRALKYELNWIRCDIPREERGMILKPLGRAYLATLLRLPGILWDRYFRFLPLGDESFSRKRTKSS